MRPPSAPVGSVNIPTPCSTPKGKQIACVPASRHIKGSAARRYEHHQPLTKHPANGLGTTEPQQTHEGRQRAAPKQPPYKAQHVISMLCSGCSLVEAVGGLHLDQDVALDREAQRLQLPHLRASRHSIKL